MWTPIIFLELPSKAANEMTGLRRVAAADLPSVLLGADSPSWRFKPLFPRNVGTSASSQLRVSFESVLGPLRVSFESASLLPPITQVPNYQGPDSSCTSQRNQNTEKRNKVRFSTGTRHDRRQVDIVNSPNDVV